MEELIFWLRQMPKPDRAWKAIERFLLKDSEVLRKMGFDVLLAGAIMETISDSEKHLYLSQIESLAEVVLKFYEDRYKGDVAIFNEHRLNLRESIKGLLASPVGRPRSPDSMTKKSRAWSMPDKDWQWLEAQPNQSETLRMAVQQYRKNPIC